MNSPGFRGLAHSTLAWIRKWRHPFWWLPDVPSSQAEAYRRIWQHLRQTTELADGRHAGADWREREGTFVVLCARVPVTSFEPIFDDLETVLSELEYAELWPRNAIYVPVQEIGLLKSEPIHRDGFDQKWLDEFISQVENPITEFPPFEVELGGVNAYSDAVFLDVRDNGWLSRIHLRVLDFVAQPPNNRFSYLPEAIVALFTERREIGNLVRVLTPFRDVDFARFRVAHIDAVYVRLDDGLPSVETFHEFALGRRQMLTETVPPQLS